ncbi:hypothetical protein FHR90_003433 [Endobacter medicaginis]|uniref:Phage major capsid protein n=1 Tax=Endobacter medicaginis TaxID=1181271 RepID=A0A839V7P5_9PROT|nr:hypothetical protein [Endobacter medicaginis]NVN30603.1 phage major capsid protein [Endobacter medicaginis]
MIVGDWSDLIVGQWGPIEILVNPYASGSYEAGNIKVRALASVDIAVRHPQSFTVLNKATS